MTKGLRTDQMIYKKKAKQTGRISSKKELNLKGYR